MNKFGSLPFSFGARTCIGRRVAELEIRISLAHVSSDVWSQVHSGNVCMCILPFSILCTDYNYIRRFNLSYMNTELISLNVEKLIIRPDKPVLLSINNAS